MEEIDCISAMASFDIERPVWPKDFICSLLELKRELSRSGELGSTRSNFILQRFLFERLDQIGRSHPLGWANLQDLGIFSRFGCDHHESGFVSSPRTGLGSRVRARSCCGMFANQVDDQGHKPSPSAQNHFAECTSRRQRGSTTSSPTVTVEPSGRLIFRHDSGIRSSNKLSNL